VPYPFTRGIFVYGDPIEIPREASDEEIEGWRVEVERRMNALAADTERDFDEIWRAAK
jgi:lysophospholipid acyltransferase (LPLAT)-like uncharacterized protein